ncbi:MAG: right-handed parallel beta-helix repeat-containing protein, partial [Verrucomicrobiae bacterium]|nr:right-handed parallel beta-helix repeat-containing protein [Verrucomicrobiae bacterium]
MSGTLNTNTTWSLAGSPYTLTGNVTVAAGVTLTIQPGVQVIANQFIGLTVNGVLSAVGTSGSPTVFVGSSSQPGWWAGIDITNEGSATLEYCEVKDCGYFREAGVYKRSSGSLVLRNCLLASNNGAGLRLTSGSSSFVSENNQFESNDQGVRLGINTSFSDTSSTFSDNSFAPVAVDGGTHTMDVSWELSSDYSLVISSTQTVSSGATLTLMPGLVLKSVQYVGIVVNGTLTADGTVEAPIYLTSHRDDTVGGDANNNADETAPAVGWWSGVDIQNTGSASLDHCTVAYSGYFNEAGIFMRSSGSLSLTNSTLTFTNGSGLRLTSGYDTFLSENNQFDSNHEGVRLGVNTRFSDTTSTYNNNSFAPVLVDGGTHTMDVSWELSSDFSIVINGTQTVAEGATLTLMPGLALKSVQFAGIVVRGMLKAEGTPEAPIYLTSHRDDTIGGDANNNGNGTAPFDGWWSGIDIQNTGSASFDFCTVAYSGYFNEAGIYMRSNGSLSLQNSTLKFTNGSGLRLTSGYAMIYSWNNRFEDNDLGVRLVTGASFSDTTSTFLRNSESQVGVDGGTIVADTVWDVSSHSAIILRGTVYVGADVTLTLKPGLIVKAAQYVGLVVDGTLTAQGTAVHPIIFTSSRDDSVGGDTNNDGDASVPSATWWSGLLVRDGGNATVEHCRIHYAGYFEQSGVKKRGGGDISLRNCTISNINGSGLFLDGATGLIDIVRCQFTDCDEGVFLRSVAQEVALVSCHYEGNSAYGVLNTNSGETDARSSWWGEASGPYHPEKNAEGLGDRVSDNVLFEPWRQTPGILDILSPTRSGSIVAGDTLRFLGSPLDSPLAGYSWNFGDGRTSNTRNPGLVTFSATGNFQVQYAVTNAGVPDPYPQIRELEVVANGGSHPDLSVTSLVVPSSIGIGQSVSIDYTVVNNGPSTLPSTTWTDRIYLSGDRFLDTPDTLLGSVGVTRSLAPGASYQGSLSVIVPPIEQGAHYLILSANDDWDAVELHRLNNEKPVSVNVLVPKLEQGVAFDGEFGAGSIEQYFRIDASGSKNLLVDFQKLEPNLTAYLRFGELPNRSMFDYRLGSNSL